MNSVSSTEDIKPPLGINGVMKVPAQPSGTVLSLTKHICAICGDRSSGELPGQTTQNLPIFLFYFVFFNFQFHGEKKKKNISDLFECDTLSRTAPERLLSLKFI